MSGQGDFLEDVALFYGMGREEIGFLSSFLSPRSLKAGDIVFREGERGTELFIVRSGLIGSRAALPDGGSREVYDFGPGTFFGEMAVVDGESRSSTCYAREDSELLALDAIDFFHIVYERPVLGVKLLTAMARVLVTWLGEASGLLAGIMRWGEAARRRAVVDGSTGLFNRRYLEESMRLRLSRRSGSSSYIMLDMDLFRGINAAMGQAAGDAVIAQAGAAFSGALGKGRIGARLAGDEFAFFLPEEGRPAALDLAEKLRAVAEGLFLEFKAGPGAEPERIMTTASLGVASFPEDAASPADLVLAADRALLAAKRLGRNRVVSASELV